MTDSREEAQDAMQAERDLLLWIDLETTGSDEARDCIIEVGAILTTTELDVLGECSIVVAPTAEGLGRLMQNAFVRDMHQRNGLLPLLLDAETPAYKPHEAAKTLLAWAERLGAKQGRTVLAGSGVGHFDRRFIARWMPQVDKFLRYWCIDIGVVRRAHDLWVGTPVSAANDAKTHRGLDDIRCHVEEARAFRDLWQSGSGVSSSGGN